MRVVVDFEQCESNAVCVALVPEVFDLREDDSLDLLIDEPAAELHQQLRHAVSGCPKLAITLEE